MFEPGRGSRLRAPDPPEVGVAERGRQLEPIARRAIHADVGDEDGTDELNSRQREREPDSEHDDPWGPVVEDVINGRPDSAVGEVAGSGGVGQQEQRDGQQPIAVEGAVKRETGDE